MSAENILRDGIDLTRGEESVDNGRGFYTTPNMIFAMKRAKMAANRKKRFFKDGNVRPVVLKIDMELDDNMGLAVKEFKACSFGWKEFILYNRLGKRFLKKWDIKSGNHNLDLKYDVVIDETADSGVNDLVSETRYKKEIGDLDEIIRQVDRSEKPYWDKQISFHSRQAVEKCIRSMEIVEVQETE